MLLIYILVSFIELSTKVFTILLSLVMPPVEHESCIPSKLPDHSLHTWRPTLKATSPPLSCALSNLVPRFPSAAEHITDARRAPTVAEMTHLGMCCRWSSPGSSCIPPPGFHCPYRCTTARWSSWSSCCRHSWESSLSLRGQAHIKTH